jgi:catechol 2,3-dioxygenase-like lactoylglutathione lyase family enzyme
MIDHISVRVQDFGRAVAFYKAALAPLGYDVRMEYPGAAGLGEPGKPDLWLMQTEVPLNPTHLAFSATREAIDAFYAAALSAGGSDNGAPGLRLDYHPNYYAAYVHDPEGNNIEVVCHFPPGMPKPPAKKAAAKARRPKAKAKPKAKARKAAPKKAKKKAKKRR